MGIKSSLKFVSKYIILYLLWKITLECYYKWHITLYNKKPDSRSMLYLNVAAPVKFSPKSIAT